ncbi:MAG: ABC transporter permease [Candidatus Sumerlaeaceae bacterium]|nr:ABC transporter permease [Candidatus Sumerlaeaceae bacterium]
MKQWLIRNVLAPAVALAFSIIVGMAFLAVTGYPVLSTFRSIVQQSFQDWYGVGQVLHTATMLTFTGLAVAVAFRAGLFNIGVEGQLYVGSMALGIVGYYLRALPKETIQWVPWVLWIMALTAIAMVAAGLYATIPGILKAFTGAHEVITTIMLNFVALAWINYLLRYDPQSFAVPATVRTPAFPESLRLPRLSHWLPIFQGSVVNASLFFAVVASVAIWWLLRSTKLGYEIRAVGKNPVAACLAGISPRRITILAMFLSGALAGLVGVSFVLGHKGYFEENFSGGLGFLGIAVALLANNHPLGVLLTALLFGVLNYGKVAAAGEIPKDIIEIMEAAIIFSVVIANSLFTRWLVAATKRQLKRREHSADT